jgi:uncharacterized protein
MLKHSLVTASAIVLIGASAGADEVSHRKAAIELLDALKMRDSVTGGVEAMADVMVQSNPQLAPYRDVLVEWATKTMTWEAMLPGLIEIYQQALTEPEIRETIKFFKTKTGQKWVTAMPDLMRKGSAIGAKVGEAHQDQLKTMNTSVWSS